MGQLKILLIGAEGFIGSNAYKELVKKYNVIPILKSHNIDFGVFSVVEKLLQDINPDVVLNCLTYVAKHTVNNDSGEEVGKNLAMFYNFMANEKYFKKYINIGSGAEFDRISSINQAKEESINDIIPVDAYGFNKNLIARMIQSINNKFFNLRVFGCFGANERDTRLLKRFLNSKDTFILDHDRYFDYISIQDLISIIDYVILENVKFVDLNCVYDSKLKLSQFLDLFCKINKIDKKFEILYESSIHYTGSCQRLYSIGSKLQGLELGMQDYFQLYK